MNKNEYIWKIREKLVNRKMSVKYPFLLIVCLSNNPSLSWMVVSRNFFGLGVPVVCRSYMVGWYAVHCIVLTWIYRQSLLNCRQSLGIWYLYFLIRKKCSRSCCSASWNVAADDHFSSCCGHPSRWRVIPEWRHYELASLHWLTIDGKP